MSMRGGRVIFSAKYKRDARRGIPSVAMFVGRSGYGGQLFDAKNSPQDTGKQLGLDDNDFHRDNLPMMKFSSSGACTDE